MTPAQKYFVQAIVGAPQRLVLGQYIPVVIKPIVFFPKTRAAIQRTKESIGDFVARFNVPSLPEKVAAPQVKTADVIPATQPKRAYGRYVLIVVSALITLSSATQLASSWYKENKSAFFPPSVKANTAEVPVAKSPPLVAAEVVNPVPLSESPAPVDGGPLPQNIAQAIPQAKKSIKLVAAVNPTKGAPTPAKPVQAVPPVVVAVLPLAGPTVAATKPKEEERQSAMVIDAQKPDDIKPVVAAVEPAVMPPTLRRFPEPIDLKSPKPKDALPVPVKAARPANKVTIVDIATDGSYTLITNPETRLPKKFIVGEKVHTGETIQKIDPKSGKITFDTRTITME